MIQHFVFQILAVFGTAGALVVITVFTWLIFVTTALVAEFFQAAVLFSIKNAAF